MIRDDVHHLETAIEGLGELMPAFPLARNTLRPKPSAAALVFLKRHLASRRLPEGMDLIQLYEIHDGLSLPDVRNGYFIHPAEWFKTAEAFGEPNKASGDDSFNLLVFGSDGGGGRFACRLDSSPDIVFLGSSGAVYSNAYDLESGSVKSLADDLGDFLRKITADVEAFGRGDQGWSYLTDEY